MPFDFLKRKKDEPAAAEPAPAAGAPAPRPAAAAGSPFDAVTEEWRLVGPDGRRRPPLRRPQQARADADHATSSWAPVDGSEPIDGGAGPAGHRPVRPDPRPRRRDLAAADDRRRADRPPDPQGLLRPGARGAAVPGRRDRPPLSGDGARRGCSTARARCSCRSSTRARRSASSAIGTGAATSSWSTASTCAAWSRSTAGPVSGRAAARADAGRPTTRTRSAPTDRQGGPRRRAGS